MYYLLRVSLLFLEILFDCMEKYQIILEVEKFKEILLYGWHLLPPEKQKELIEMGVYPRKDVPCK